jgi:hypothetical protein
MQLNEAGRRKGKSMIESSQYVLDSSWTDANPSADEENTFLENHTWAEFGEWHLGVDPTAAEETKERYGFPYGDFRRVHRSGLIAAKQRAAQNDYADIERAPDSLLSLLDQQTG